MGTILLKNIVSEGIASDILIEDNLIVKVVPSDNQCIAPEGAEVVDCTGKAAFPGFINMHTHAGMALMKGIGEDMAFLGLTGSGRLKSISTRNMSIMQQRQRVWR